MDHLHLNSEIDEEYPLMASVEAQMRGVTMSASNSRFLNLPGESTYHYARYIRDFYPPSDEATMLRYRGHIISVVGHSRDEDMGVDEFYDADIARVVSLVARSPKLRFTFELQKDLKRYSSAAKSIAQVNSMLSLFADSSDSEWRDMAKSIKEMRLRVQYSDSALRITMEQDMAKKWKTAVHEMWNEAAQPTRGIRELRLSWPDPNPQERSYGQPGDVFKMRNKVLWIIIQQFAFHHESGYFTSSWVVIRSGASTWK
ncbi:uncharacterized protein J4E92_003139 [Alternaria infectoria]|uniref:uncharacterized protein n=1 Tax=Alternaria infectoria TaxID=45303 RepID=UPI002220D9E7|nr:uncharacterized protein J4E92_003139 [Alternaria infectoria]KAI4933472.1 hypothetical protein J4E92_003139 [Alternaria infectoria]